MEKINRTVKILDGTTMAAQCESIRNTAKTLYFQGHNLEKFLGNDSFSLLQDSVKVGLCHELSVIAMLCLVHNDTARLCKGEVTMEDDAVEGVRKFAHSWVEFEVPANGTYVIDFGWGGNGFICDKETFYTIPDKLVEKWSMSYGEFWKIPFIQDLYKAMKNREHSYVLEDLSRYCTPGDNGYEMKCHKYKSGDFQIGYPLRTQLPITVIKELYKNPST